MTAVALGKQHSARIKLTERLDKSQLRILHPRGGKQNKQAMIQSSGLWKLPLLEDYSEALAIDSIQALNTWLEQICVQ